MARPSESTPLDHQIAALRSISAGNVQGFDADAVKVAQRAIKALKAAFDKVQVARR